MIDIKKQLVLSHSTLLVLQTLQKVIETQTGQQVTVWDCTFDTKVYTQDVREGPWYQEYWINGHFNFDGGNGTGGLPFEAKLAITRPTENDPDNGGYEWRLDTKKDYTLSLFGKTHIFELSQPYFSAPIGVIWHSL